MNSLKTTLVALMVMGVTTHVIAAPTEKKMPQSTAQEINSPAQDAWSHYQQTLIELRQRFLKNEWAKNPELRAQGLYFLQSLEAVAFNMYVATRPQYPALYTQSFFMPLEISWGMPNPDFMNRNGFIDGAHTYRVYGNVRQIRWATLQVSNGFWGDEAQNTIANVDFDELPKDKDGNFEIFLGPNPPTTPNGKYWIKTDPAQHNTWLVVREVIYDWKQEKPMEFHIENLDRVPNAPIYFDETELAQRIEKARKYVLFCFNFTEGGALRWLAKPADEADKKTAGGSSTGTPLVHEFQLNVMGQQQGGNPLGYWISMLYDIKPDEALILEVPFVQARYWGFQLGSIWGQTTDYSYHQSSINMEQVKVDADGKVRAVLSLQDPGVPNWLDPAGLSIGTALFRIYKSESYAIPVVTKVKLATLRDHLPKETSTVTPEQRQHELRDRQRAALGRFGQ